MAWQIAWLYWNSIIDISDNNSNFSDMAVLTLRGVNNGSTVGAIRGGPQWVGAIKNIGIYYVDTNESELDFIYFPFTKYTSVSAGSSCTWHGTSDIFEYDNACLCRSPFTTAIYIYIGYSGMFAKLASIPDFDKYLKLKSNILVYYQHKHMTVYLWTLLRNKALCMVIISHLKCFVSCRQCL